ncbi:hypothetical protein [Deinococcus pimensis]|uniref:hypothetical protein n=1 Tax=Deinococcus pimensis TaxID=309888 RepID=UPI0004809765|nr:hypothetical protein [Deinococcus pimensis]
MHPRALLLAGLTLLTLSACRQEPPMTMTVPTDTRVLQGTWTGEARSAEVRDVLGVTPDGQRFLSVRLTGQRTLGPDARETRVLELRDASTGVVLAEHDVSDLGWTPDVIVTDSAVLLPGHLASALLSLPDLREVKRFGPATHASPEGDRLYARDPGGTLRVTSVPSGEVTLVTGVQGGPVVALPGGRLLFDREVRHFPDDTVERTLNPSKLAPCADRDTIVRDAALRHSDGALAVVYDNAEVQVLTPDGAVVASTRLSIGCGNFYRLRWTSSGELEVWWTQSVDTDNDVPWDEEVRLVRWDPRTLARQDLTRWQAEADASRAFEGLSFTPTPVGELLVAKDADVLRVRTDGSVAWRRTTPPVPGTLDTTAQFVDRGRYTFDGTLKLGTRTLDVTGSAMGSRVEFQPQWAPQVVTFEGTLRDGGEVVGRVEGTSGLKDPEQRLVVTLERERYEVTMRRP